MNSVRIRSLALCGAAGFLLAGSAYADDRQISDSVTTPVETSDPAGDGGGHGNIEITTGGSVSLDSAGTAVTINSNNSVTNAGSIVNSAESGAIGLNIRGGHRGDLRADHHAVGIMGNGSISVGGGDTPGAGNIGVLLDGSGTFRGDLDLSAMTLQAVGPGAVGMEIDTRLHGDIHFGTTTVTGENAFGLRTTAVVDGTISNDALVTMQGVSTFSTTAIDPRAGSAFAIGSDLTGGFVNVGPVNASDAAPAGAIEQSGTSPAILISPTVAGTNAPSLTVGIRRRPRQSAPQPHQPWNHRIVRCRSRQRRNDHFHWPGGGRQRQPYCDT